MSSNLAAVDLSAATVGASNTLEWHTVISTGSPGLGVRSGRPHLRLFNESGCGLDIVFDTGRSDRIPAGAWALYQLSGERSLTWKVTYILPGAPVSLLLGVVYEPGETVPDAPQLGNSPIGIGGTVNTTTTPQVINDGNAAPYVVVEATPLGAASSQLKLNNDGSAVLGGGLITISNAGIFTALPASAIPSSAIAAGNLTIATITASNGAKVHPVAPGSADDAIYLYDRNGVTGVSLGWAQTGVGFFAWDQVNGGYVFSGGTKAGISFTGAVTAGGRVTANGGTSTHPTASTIDDSLIFFDRNGVNGSNMGWAQSGGGLYAWDAVNGGFIFSGGTKAGIFFTGNISSSAGSGIPTTRNGGALSVPIFTGTTTPVSPPTGALWAKA